MSTLLLALIMSQVQIYTSGAITKCDSSKFSAFADSARVAGGFTGDTIYVYDTTIIYDTVIVNGSGDSVNYAILAETANALSQVVTTQIETLLCVDTTAANGWALFYGADKIVAVAPPDDTIATCIRAYYNEIQRYKLENSVHSSGTVWDSVAIYIQYGSWTESLAVIAGLYLAGDTIQGESLRTWGTLQWQTSRQVLTKPGGGSFSTTDINNLQAFVRRAHDTYADAWVSTIQVFAYSTVLVGYVENLVHDSLDNFRSVNPTLRRSVATVGNSMSVGQYILGSNGYGSILCSLFTPPLDYYKMCVNGRTSETMLDSIAPALDDSVGIVLIEAGAADGHNDSMATIGNIRAMLDSCHAHFKLVGLWTVLPDSTYSGFLGAHQLERRAINRWILSDTCFADFVMDATNILGNDESMYTRFSNDARHTNPTGDTMLARLWARILKPYIF